MTVSSLKQQYKDKWIGRAGILFLGYFTVTKRGLPIKKKEKENVDIISRASIFAGVVSVFRLRYMFAA